MKEQNNLKDHPAVKEWLSFNPNGNIPNDIEVLKDKKKVKVFRLHGVGPDNLAIIAKGSKDEKLEREKTFYKNVFPNYKFTSIEYYGFVKNEKEDFSWLFLEDAKGEIYSQSNEEHRQAAIKWLAELHSSLLSKNLVSILPEISLLHMYDYLRKTKSNIINNIQNPVFTGTHILILEEAVKKLKKIEAKWELIEFYSSKLPLALVHGDLKSNNIYIRRNKSKTQFLPFDWEMGGYGHPVMDLHMLFKFPENEVKMYYSRIKKISINLKFEDILKLLAISRIIRLIIATYWASLRLSLPHIEKPVRRINGYSENLSTAFDSLDW